MKLWNAPQTEVFVKKKKNFIPTERLNLRDNDLGACLVLHIQNHKYEHC